MAKKSKITDITDMQDRAKKIKKLADIGIDVEEIKALTLESFNNIFDRYTAVIGKLDTNRERFVGEITDAVGHWTFEEMFVFTIDILNSILLDILNERLPDDKKGEVDIDSIFPAVYDEVYEMCIKELTKRYAKE